MSLNNHSFFQKLVRMMSCLCLVVILGACASSPALPPNSTLMNIWVSPEYLEIQDMHTQHYIAVIVTGVAPASEITASAGEATVKQTTLNH